MIGKVAIIEGIRPGVITFTLGHGMWATGASDVVIDGMRFKGPENGSVSFYDTKVKLVAV